MAGSPKSFLSFARAVPASDHQPRLYCFAYAGSSCSIYASWARALAPAVTVLGVEMPGHGSRFDESPLESVAEMARAATDAIEAAPSNAPYVFYGHSLGALVAFEAARLLQARGAATNSAALRHLYVGAARAPHLPPVMPKISHLPSAEFLDAVQHRYGGLPAVLFDEPELLEMALPILRADFGAYENYKYEPSSPSDIPVTAFHGRDDTVVRNAAVSEWSQVTERTFRMEEMPGDHFFLNNCRDALLRTISESFDRGIGDHPTGEHGTDEHRTDNKGGGDSAADRSSGLSAGK